MQELSKETAIQYDNPIDKVFLEEKILSSEKNDFPWEWDIISKIFHVGTKDIPIAHTIDNSEKYVKEYVHFCEAGSDTAVKILTEKEGELYYLPKPQLDLLDEKSLLFSLKKRMTSRFFQSFFKSTRSQQSFIYDIWSNSRRMGTTRRIWIKTVRY